MAYLFEQQFLCPYCCSVNHFYEEYTGGHFLQDCETCCRPIKISLHIHGNELIDLQTEIEG